MKLIEFINTQYALLSQIRKHDSLVPFPNKWNQNVQQLNLIMEFLNLKNTFTLKVHKSNSNQAFLLKKNLFRFIGLPVDNNTLIQWKEKQIFVV